MEEKINKTLKYVKKRISNIRARQFLFLSIKYLYYKKGRCRWVFKSQCVGRVCVLCFFLIKTSILHSSVIVNIEKRTYKI